MLKATIFGVLLGIGVGFVAHDYIHPVLAVILGMIASAQGFAAWVYVWDRNIWEKK